MKRTFIVLFSFVIVVSFFAYNNSQDINKRDICLCILLSRDNANDSFEFIAEIASLSNKSIGEEFEYLDVYTVDGVGSSYEKGRVAYESKLTNPLFLGSVKTVIFDRAHAEYGILSYLNRIKGLTDYRKNLIPCVSLDEFDNLINRKLFKGTSLGFNTEAILKYQSLIGNGIIMTAGELFTLKSDTDVGYVLPLIKIDRNMLQFYGQGIFKDNKMIDTKSVSECNGLNYLLNKNFSLKKPIRLEKYPDNFYSMSLTRDSLKIKTEYKDNVPHFHIDLRLNGKLYFQYEDNELSRDDVIEVEKNLSKTVQGEIEEIIFDAQNKYECDIFNMKKYFRTYNFDILRDQEWPELFSKAKFHVTVRTKLNDLSLFDAYQK